MARLPPRLLTVPMTPEVALALSEAALAILEPRHEYDARVLALDLRRAARHAILVDQELARRDAAMRELERLKHERETKTVGLELEELGLRPPPTTEEIKP